MGPRSNDLGKERIVDGCLEWHRASMGPRSNDLGKFMTEKYGDYRSQLLQWGRDRMISESPIDAEVQILKDEASMGPRSNDLGKSLASRSAKRSSGPLQWGRDRMISES